MLILLFVCVNVACSHTRHISYYEETYSHGNLFRGWDAFVDAKDVGVKDATGASRRVPADTRWFSGSCRSISRNSRPPPLVRSLQTSGPRPSSTTNITGSAATPAPVLSMRSESNTPTLSNSQLETSSNGSGRESPISGKKSTELQSASQPNVSRKTDEGSNRQEEKKASAMDIAVVSEGYDRTAIEVSSDKAMNIESTDDKKDPLSGELSSSMKDVELSTKQNSKLVDMPIPKKKDSKYAMAKPEMDAEAGGATPLLEEAAPNTDVSTVTEVSKKEYNDARPEQEELMQKERGASPEEPPKHEDPFKRRITRKRKSVAEGD